jgi:sugar/nucleoside kinase (ribokinase family)
MTTPRYDVLGIGNAIVDVIARTEDDFLARQDMHKGAMALIDEARAQTIYDAMGPATEISGGSAANTIVGVASFGARAAFIGKVKDDELGRAFTHDIRASGVSFDTPPACRRLPTRFTRSGRATLLSGAATTASFRRRLNRCPRAAPRCTLTLKQSRGCNRHSLSARTPCRPRERNWAALRNRSFCHG